jgi:hypothetical protein
LSDDEIEMRDKFRGLNYSSSNGFGDKTVMEYFDSPREVELWMEINSPKLTDQDYVSLTPELKKKYIALGMDLTPKQISSSEAAVLNYYAKQKIEKIKNSSLNNLSSADIALLNAPIFAKTKEELRTKFAENITVDGGSKFVMKGMSDGNVAKFASLYGLESVFESLPIGLKDINIAGDGPSGTPLQIPRSITRFKNLEHLTLQNNSIDEVPEFICELKELQMLGIKDNPGLSTLPECLAELPNFLFINFTGTNLKSIPEALKEKMFEVSPGIYSSIDF